MAATSDFDAGCRARAEGLVDARTSAKSAREEYVSSSYSMTVHVLLDGAWQDEEKFCGVTEGRDLNFGATLSKTSLEFTAAGRCTKTNSTSTTWSDRGKRGTKQWRARSASNVWQSRFGGNLRSGTATATATPQQWPEHEKTSSFLQRNGHKCKGS